jgi:hypothetical protein
MFKRIANDPKGVHWSRDFVEHLRTVHFALIAVSVALILILSRTKSPALQQIREIVALKKEWPPEWIVQAHPERSSIEGPRSGHHVSTDWTSSGEFLGVVEWKKDHRREEVRLIIASQNWVDTSGSLSKFPGTLGQFHYWWNNSFDNFSPRMDLPIAAYDGTVYATEKGPILATIHLISFSKLSSTVTSVRDRRKVINLDLEFGGRADSDIYIGYDGDLQYELPLSMRYTEIDKESLRYFFRNWRVGRFEDSFAALAEEAGGLEPEDLEQVEKVIGERLANRLEEFDAFGMKFPIDQVTGWGTIIVLSVQLYFLLYLKQLSGKLRPDDPAWDTPWICMNQSRLAQSVCFVTIVLLPIIALCLLGAKGSLRLTTGYWDAESSHLLVSFRDWDWAIKSKVTAYVLSTILGAALGIASWVSRPRLSVEADQHCSSQLFE